MALSGPIPGIDLVGEFFGAVISLMITYYAHKAYRLSGQRSLFLLYLGFLLIGVGFVSQALAILVGVFLPTGAAPVPASLRGFVRLLLLDVIIGSGIHWILEILGYIAIFVAYLFQARDIRVTGVPALGILAFQVLPITLARLFFRPELELIIFLILVFTIVQVIVIYVPQRHNSTLYVVLGFLFIALAHLAFLFFALAPPDSSDTIYVFGHILQLVGFLLLLVMLLNTTRSQ